MQGNQFRQLVSQVFEEHPQLKEKVLAALAEKEKTDAMREQVKVPMEQLVDENGNLKPYTSY